MTTDLCMFVGENHYPWPNDFSEEAQRVGVSKRVSRKSIPHIVPGETRLVLIHPKAIVKVTAEGMGLWDLAAELVLEHIVHAKGYGEDWLDRFILGNIFDEQAGEYTSGLTRMLRAAERAKDLKRIEEKYGIEYFPGVFGWCPLSGIQYVAKSDDETELPPDLAGVSGIEIVRMDYG